MTAQAPVNFVMVPQAELAEAPLVVEEAQVKLPVLVAEDGAKDVVAPVQPVSDPASEQPANPSEVILDAEWAPVTKPPEQAKAPFWSAVPLALWAFIQRRRVARKVAQQHSASQPPQKLSWRQKRWQRRHKRHVFEEIMAWILVPLIVLGAMWLVNEALHAMGTSPAAVYELGQTIFKALQGGGR